jgi:HK97 family phage prohead protease
MVTPLQISGETKRIESDYYVEGYAAKFNEPYLLHEAYGVKYYEDIAPSAFDDTTMDDVIFLYDHEGRVLARKKNGSLIVEPDSRGLFVAVDLSRSDAAKAIYRDIQAELVTKMSWACTVSEDSYDKDTNTRKILKVSRIYDVSAVSIPANDATSISARSRAEGIHFALAAERRKRAIRTLLLKIQMEESK